MWVLITAPFVKPSWGRHPYLLSLPKRYEMKILLDPVVIISVLFHGLFVIKVIYLTLFLNFDLFQKFVQGPYL